MSRNITMKGNKLTLSGEQIKIGDKAPNFKAVDVTLDDVTLSGYKGMVKIVTSFPSIDTSVCELQVKEFNKRASELPDVKIIGISMDLPFAQNRFCEAYKIGNVDILSDYKYNSFGKEYNLLIHELKLLARAVLIIDKNDIVRYIQIVDEVTNQPDYDDVIKNLKNIN